MSKKALKSEENRPLLSLARIVAEAYEGERNAFDQLVVVEDEATGEESIEPKTDSGSDLEDLIVWMLAGVYEQGLDKQELIQRALETFISAKDVFDKIIAALESSQGDEK